MHKHEPTPATTPAATVVAPVTPIPATSEQEPTPLDRWPTAWYLEVAGVTENQYRQWMVDALAECPF